MEKYILAAKDILMIADGVAKKNISLTEVPFGEILKLAENVYRGKEAAEFINDYAKLFQNSLEQYNSEEAAVILRLLARHMMILAIDKEIDGERFKSYCACMQYFFNLAKVEKWHAVHKTENMKCFQGKGVVYSAIIGNYDDVKEPEYINPDLDYILFTDNPNITSSVWKIRLVKNPEGLDNVRLARKIKIMGHLYLREYDYSIWLDGKFKVVGDLQSYIHEFSKWEPVICFNHFVHDCIYMEKDACVSKKRDDIGVMEKQIQKYREEGYPEHNGLAETGIMVREIHDESVVKVMETWWSEVLNGSRRDQLSFNYACWKNDFVYDSTYLYIYFNQYIEEYKHNI